MRMVLVLFGFNGAVGERPVCCGYSRCAVCPILLLVQTRSVGRFVPKVFLGLLLLVSQEPPLNSVFPMWLQDLNTGLGIVGFVITVIVMIQVASIKRSFRSRARLPEVVKELQKAGSALSTNLDGWPARKNDALMQVKVASVLVRNAIPLVAGDTKKQLKAIHKKFLAAADTFDDPKYQSLDAAWDLYSDVQQVITNLSQSIRTLKWD